MDWQFAVGLSLTLIFGVLPFMVKDLSPWITVPIVVVGIGFMVWGAMLWSHRKRDSSNAPQVSAFQSIELQKITEFLGGKDEHELQEQFDFLRFTTIGLRRAKQILAPDSVPQTDSDEIGRYFSDGGQAIFNPNYLHMTQVNGSPRADPIPGKVGILIVSKQYVASRRQLAEFAASPLVPADVQKSIKALDETVVHNSYLMIDVINEQLAQDPNNILRGDDLNSPYSAVTANAYLRRFVELKPKADDVLAKIRAFLKTS
jgi:hypothetical protein